MEVFLTGLVVLAGQILATLLWSKYRGWPTILVWGVAWGVGCLAYFVALTFLPPLRYLLYAILIGCLAELHRWHRALPTD